MGIFPYALDEVRNAGSQQVPLGRDTPFPASGHQVPNTAPLLSHIHPSSTQGLEWWEGGEGAALREVKAELEEWKENHSDTRGKTSPLKGCSKRRVSKGKGQPATN